MTAKKKPLAAALLLTALAAWAIIAAHLPGQADLTEENLYTLSEASRDLVHDLEEPITLEYYFSRSLDELPVSWKNYGALVEDLLHQYARAADGKVRLRVIDPKLDSDEEQAAVRAGIETQTTPGGGLVAFGLVATSGDQTETIPIFTPQRESFLEYDISQLIFKATRFEKPLIGVISSLPIFGSGPVQPNPYMPQQPPQSPAWVFVEQLQGSYTVEEITGDTLPEALTALALIHPDALSPALQFAVDQFLLSGRPVYVAVDPSSYIERSTAGQQAMMMGGGFSSDLSGLLEKWGIMYDASVVVGDAELATPVSTGAGQPIQYPYWLTLRDFPAETPLTSELEETWLMEPGSFALAEDSSLELQPLLWTTGASGTTDAMSLSFQGPMAAVRAFAPDGETRTLAGLITGEFATAFPDGAPPLETEDGEETDGSAETPPPLSAEGHKSGQGTLFLVADVDFLSDQMSVQRINFLGMGGLSPLNDNLTFTLNSFDSLTGDETLLALRGKGEVRRPFTRIDAMERKAQEAYQRQVDTLQAQLDDVQARLSELDQSQDGQSLVATPEVLAAIEEYRVEEANLRAELREIRKKLREDVDRLEFRLAALNIFLLPVLILGVGLFSFFRRSQTRK